MAKIDPNLELRRTFVGYTPRGTANLRRRKLKYILEKYKDLRKKDVYMELLDIYNTPVSGIDFKNLTVWGGLFTPEEGEVLEEFGNQMEINLLGKRRVNKYV